MATVAPFMKPVPESVTVLAFDPRPIEDGLAPVTTGGGETVKHPTQFDDPSPSSTVTVRAPVGALGAMVILTLRWSPSMTVEFTVIPVAGENVTVGVTTNP